MNRSEDMSVHYVNEVNVSERLCVNAVSIGGMNLRWVSNTKHTLLQADYF